MGRTDHVTVDFDELEIDAKRRLLTPIDTIDWSVRARNVLAGMNVVVMGQLAQQDYWFVWRRPKLGRKTRKEIKNAMTELGLPLGLEIDNWPKQEDLPNIMSQGCGDETGEEQDDGVGKGLDFMSLVSGDEIDIDFETANENHREIEDDHIGVLMGYYISNDVAGATEKASLETKASYLLQWHVSTEAKERGLRWYDLGGIDPVGNPGVCHFKRGLGGDEVVAPGIFQINPRGGFGWLTRLAGSASHLYRGFRERGRH